MISCDVHDIRCELLSTTRLEFVTCMIEFLEIDFSLKIVAGQPLCMLHAGVGIILKLDIHLLIAVGIHLHGCMLGQQAKLWHV